MRPASMRSLSPKSKVLGHRDADFSVGVRLPSFRQASASAFFWSLHFSHGRQERLLGDAAKNQACWAALVCLTSLPCFWQLQV